ncbi:MAG: hypothetical protein JRJ57_09515 [Deltaproteobacteria bacterium]|nr:hypothetical protein [Deltaproteobacteria bacterium]
MTIPKNNIEITRKTIGQLLNEIAAKYPNNIALVHSDSNIRYNYNLFLSEINRAAPPIRLNGLSSRWHLQK